MLLADYAEYVKAQERVDELFKVKNKRKSLNEILRKCL
jgi:hypothetical protein